MENIPREIKPFSASIALTTRVRAFGLLLIVELLYGWAWNSVDVIRPQLREEFGLSLVQVGAFYSVQAAGALLGALFLGQIADRCGRRNVLMGVLLGFGILLALGASTTSYLAMVGQRFLLGVSLGGVAPIVGSLYIGLFPAHLRGRLASLLNAVFTLSIVALSASIALLPSSQDWRLLLWIGGAAPVLLVPFMLLLPDDRRFTAYDELPSTNPVATATFPVAALLAPGLRRLTLLLVLMAGFNYFAAQAFTGWTASFLSEVRQMDSGSVGTALAWQAAGSLLGGFFWGWFADRRGRRAAVIGYVAGAVLMTAYLTAVQDEGMFRWMGFAVGFAIAASVIWPPWMAEIFPEPLRATALSIFNWGRIVSLFAPLATGAVAEDHGLGTAMLLGPLALLAVALLWRQFPETLGRPPWR